MIYLLALEAEMQMALRLGSATLVPDWGLPLEAFFVVPLIIGLTAWAGLAQAKALGHRSREEQVRPVSLHQIAGDGVTLVQRGTENDHPI